MKTGMFRLSEKLGNLTTDDLIQLELKYNPHKEWYEPKNAEKRLKELSGKHVFGVWPYVESKLSENDIALESSVEIADEDEAYGVRSIDLIFVREGLDNSVGT